MKTYTLLLAAGLILKIIGLTHPALDLIGTGLLLAVFVVSLIVESYKILTIKNKKQ